VSILFKVVINALNQRDKTGYRQPGHVAHAHSSWQTVLLDRAVLPPEDNPSGERRAKMASVALTVFARLAFHTSSVPHLKFRTKQRQCTAYVPAKLTHHHTIAVKQCLH